jgi:hypothetical protein
MPRFLTGKRRSKRIISVEPARLWVAGSEDSHLAHTIDVSRHGAKFGGCRGEFKVGDTIEVLYRHKHTQAEWLGSPLAKAPRRSKSGLSFWSRKNRYRARILRLDTTLVFRPKDGVVANEEVRSISASEAKDAPADCKRKLDWFKNFDPKSQAH